MLLGTEQEETNHQKNNSNGLGHNRRIHIGGNGMAPTINNQNQGKYNKKRDGDSITLVTYRVDPTLFERLKG